MSRQRFVYFPAARAETIDDHHKITFKDQRGNLKSTPIWTRITASKKSKMINGGQSYPTVHQYAAADSLKCRPAQQSKTCPRLRRWRGSLELADEPYSSQYERRLIVSSRQLCLEAKVPLFHNDRDFDAIARVKRLKVYYPKPRH